MENAELTSIIGRKNRGIISCQLKVDGKSDLPSKEIDRVLNVYTETTIINKGIENGKCQFKGKVNFFVCYIDIEGNIKRTEISSPYEGEVEIPYPNSRLFLRVVTEKVESDLSSIKLELTAYLKVLVRVLELTKTDCFCGAKDIITKTKEIESEKSVELSGSYTVEDEFNFSYVVREVLLQKATSVVETVTTGISSVVVDGKVNITIISLQLGEKKDIIKEEKSLPFRAELECEDCMLNDNAWVNSYIKSFKTDVFVDENKNQTTIAVNVVLGFFGEATIKEKVNVSLDEFSITNYTREEREEISVTEKMSESTISVKVNERVGVDGFVLDSDVVTVLNESAEIVSQEYKDNKTEISGSIALSVLLRDSEGRLSIKKLEVPFSTEINGKVEVLNLSLVNTRVEKTENGYEVFSEALITLLEEECHTENVITNVYLEKEKQVNKSAISVYSAYKGEDSWDIAKRIGISPESLINANKDLIFPLNNDERIVVYRQL